MMDPTLRTQYLTARRVQQRYDITRSTLHRWINDPELGMPRPVRRRNRLYFDLTELEQWDLARARLDPTDTAAMRDRFKPKKDLPPVGSAA
jgi:predicted DNA-binding transcriptional regulator AlpA